MLSQNKLRMVAMKGEFTGIANRYRDALKYYGYSSNEKYFPVVLKHSRTLTNQSSLPRFNVPQLKSTISKYLTAVQPLLEPSEFDRTQKVVNDFLVNGTGEKLQNLLIEKSKKTENWLAQWWLDKVYLEPRYNVPMNVNPGTLYPKVDFKTIDEQLMFATKYIYGFLNFKKIIDNQELPTEKSGDSSLCMEQYYKLIGTCRIPNKDKDLIKIMQTNNLDLDKHSHITVIHNNRIFSLKVIDSKTGSVFSTNDIFSNLKKIVELSKDQDKYGLGILTAENRDVWAESYQTLIQNENNQKSFESILDSLFVLCLDTSDGALSSFADKRSSDSGQILHGNKKFTQNRWFDKTIQIIIGVDGVWGTNFEHSVAEAVPHAVLNDFVFKYIQNSNLEFENTKSNKLLEELVFQVPDEIKNQIVKSNQNLDKQIDNLDLYVLNFESFGKNFPKSQKISPDAFVQIAMQLAFFRAHNKLGNAYESGSLRKFHLGRTEIIRASTMETLEFVKSMVNSNIPQKIKTDLLLKAINAHRLYTINVMNNESFDRHLMGLKLTAIENGMELPELFKDEAYRKACHYYISSSQVSSKYEAVTIYGPAVDDGYGACYNITEKRILFGLSSYRSCSITDSKMFGDQIKNALLDCQALLIKFRSKL
ncbi:unnamed protein product [Brachionus calyciflorus]|uniref:Choline/carnitine acyltransferase domain-containing protein n=1 Tax=Brachionus calyciflorus TaxID=104777 RepID=A0A813MIB7_9BILA|nr:unnamed protein product [Brachionus calyciflorus]